VDELQAAIADQLGETEALPRRQIRRAVRALGEERARALLAEALAIEAVGGELLPDGSRRRTPGGVFFRLVRGAASPTERAAIVWIGSECTAVHLG
jgi:phosphorylated adapter RNA export protein